MVKVPFRYKKIVTRINRLASEFSAFRDADFEAKTALFRMRIKSGESLDSILPEAFALVREAAKRKLDLWAHDVQLLGAIAAHEGKIVEMKTGEGKTLTIVFSAYLNSLVGRGVHVVTANDYLAQRDANWMKGIYNLLGLSVDYVIGKSSQVERQIAYNANITYASNSEIGFDFLKDNMLYDEANRRIKDFYFAVIDEADSVLIDEAQTPLVISAEEDTEGKADQEIKDSLMFAKINPFIANLKKGVDVKVSEKERTVELTLSGHRKLEKFLGVENLYNENNQEDYLFYVDRLLKAYFLFKKDRDYIVENGEVVIVDEYTGRLMPSHRYFQGIHQAIEAKEGVLVRKETETLATITFQHLFMRYEKIAGLTGTAKTAEKEFRMIYKKRVMEIPTNRKIIRVDLPDRFFVNWQDKIDYLAWAVKEYYFKKGAALIGTRSIEKSQSVHQALADKNVPSLILNAKHTEKEAEIISKAGQPKTVTVATNMAGRGTDIELEESVRKGGGLVVFGTERHNARRIDNQLIGRSGRQGDPGLSQFLISAEDELIKTHFRKDYLRRIKQFKDPKEGVEDKELEKILKKAQKRMEEIFFEQRVLSFEFDKILEVQRESFYRQRQRVLKDKDLKEETLGLLKNEIYRIVLRNSSDEGDFISPEQLNAILVEVKNLIQSNWFQPPFEKTRFMIGKWF